MICNWLVRGLICAGEEVQRRYGVSVPRGSSCTDIERQIAELLTELINGKLDRERYEMLVTVSGLEVLVKDKLWELGDVKTVGIDWNRCPIGLALEVPAVLAGYGVSAISQWLTPLSTLITHVVIADADPEEAFQRYGVDVAVTCFVQPSWRVKTIVATCSELPTVVTTLAKALGGDPLISSTDVIVVPGNDIRLSRRRH